MTMIETSVVKSFVTIKVVLCNLLVLIIIVWREIFEGFNFRLHGLIFANACCPVYMHMHQRAYFLSLSLSQLSQHANSLSLSAQGGGSDQGPAANSFESPSKVGWLYKHGGSGMSSHWRKRWFVADHHYLFYYKGTNVSVHVTEGKLISKTSTY